MGTLDYSGFASPINMFTIDLTEVLNSDLLSQSSTQVVFGTLPVDSHQVATLTGTGFAFDAMSEFTSGTTTSVRFENSGVTQFLLTNLNIPATSFNVVFTTASMLGLLLGGGDTVLGSPFGDGLMSLGGNDSVSGGAGNDQIFAGLGNDRADGGLGDDLVRTSNGVDTLIGGDGNDTLGAGSGGDLLNGGAGADLLLASNGNDRLNGDDGDDTMLGGGGRDALMGGAGNDRLVGGTENDGFIFNPGSGADLIVDFGAGAASGDVIRLIGFGAAFDAFSDVLAASTQVGANVVIDLGAGDTITLQGVTLANLNAGDFAFG